MRQVTSTGSMSGSRIARAAAATTVLAQVLVRAKDLLYEMGAAYAPDSDKLQELQERLTNLRLYIAVLGQFKRGKSTLLNALVGEALLPSGVTPVTSVPTFLLGGPRRLARVMFRDGRRKEYTADDAAQLSATTARFVSEQSNPRNQLGVVRVEIEHPSVLLQNGVVLIDTPGIGSTLRHNTETTLGFLPQCDAALFVVSADPPVTEAEVQFLRSVRQHAARVFFLMNKADYLAASERPEAVTFFRNVLLENGPLIGDEPIYLVSARQGLEARLEQDDDAWRRSGMAEVEQRLLRFLVQEKEDTVRIAVAAKAQGMVADVLFRLRLQKRAIELPLNELERRLDVFNSKVREAEQQRVMAQDLLTADRRRVREFLEQEAGRLRGETHSQLSDVVEEALASITNAAEGERIVRQRLAQAIVPLFEDAQARTISAVEERLREVFGTHQKRANALVLDVQQAAAELFDTTYLHRDGGEPLELRHQPYWVTQDWSASLSPVPLSPGFSERLLPRGLRMKKLRGRLLDEIERVVSRNVENLRWAMVQNVEDSFRHSASQLDQAWVQILETIRSALEEGRQQGSERAGSIQQERGSLDALEAKLGRIRDDLDSQEISALL